MNQPRVLVISHNVFSTGNNMGRSLAGLFSGWDPDRLSQLYFCPEEPQLSLCRRYFRVTDVDVLRAFWTRRRPGSPLESGGDAGPAPASLRPLYRLGHTCRSPVPGLLRDALWALSPWFSPALSRWVEEARPEVIFFAPGRSVFSHRIAFRLARQYRLPVVAICYDGVYTRPKGSPLELLYHRLRMQWARRLLAGSPCLFTTCRAMSASYAPRFSIPCLELYTPYGPPPPAAGRPNAIRYFGNLGLGRWRQLAAIGRALRALALPGLPAEIEIYSREDCRRLLPHLTAENGLRFCGAIPGTQVAEQIAESFLLIHAESFAPDDLRQVSLSISTKLADYLAYAPSILAYGPEGAASICYLREQKAAFVITSEASLAQGLLKALTQESLRAEYRANARRLAAQNHDPNQIHRLLHTVLAEAAWGNRRDRP